MKTSMTDRDERELRDPAVTALLRGAFAEQAALEDAPGRTERIMRRVLDSGVRPVWRRARWAPLGWAFGSLATAAAMLLLLVRMGTTPTNYANDQTPPAGPDTAITQTAPPPDVEQPVASLTPPRTVEEQPRTTWHAPTTGAAPARTTAAGNEPARTVAQDTGNDETARRAAVTLYSAGAAARTAGDYESAFAAYQASYETSPTAEAMFASAEALVRMNQEFLTPEG